MRAIGPLILLLIFVFSARAQQVFPSLNKSADASLQKSLESCLLDLKLRDAARRKKLSVVLVDITDPHTPKMAHVNGNQMMYAASLPKLAILLGAYEKIARGELRQDPVIQQNITEMIRDSSNRAATTILNQIGIAYLSELLQSPRYRFYDPLENGGLWVGKSYGPAPAKMRDPLHQLSHGANALQVARFYYLLETGRLVSPEMSREMKSILADSSIHHKFVKGLEAVQPDSRIYRKSGTWKDYHADSAIVEHDGRRYIAVALAQSADGERWLKELIVRLDAIVCSLEPASSPVSDPDGRPR